MENNLTTTTINTNKLLKKGKQGSDNRQQSKLLTRYIQNIQVMNKRTAEEYHNRLSIFEKFILLQYNINIDELIKLIKVKDHNSPMKQAKSTNIGLFSRLIIKGIHPIENTIIESITLNFFILQF